MARPRVFISSTYYDLKVIREDIDRFISSLGFEAVRHERGQIAYGNEEKPEVYAYREIEYCDIIVSIIGGKYGTNASDSIYSISQQELKQAIDLGKQIYIFVEANVNSEFKYYLANKDVVGVKYTAVNDPRVYSFLEEIHGLPKGNPIFSFETGSDLTQILREQLAGLFQRLLIEDANKGQSSLIQELQRSLQTVDQLVKFLTEEKTKGSQAIREILFSNHPFFDAIKEATRNKYRLYFTNFNEFEDWLSAARDYKRLTEDNQSNKEYYGWIREYRRYKGPNENHFLWVKKDLFDTNGNLKAIEKSEWDDDWVKVDRQDITTKPSFDDFDDDIPF